MMIDDFGSVRVLSGDLSAEIADAFSACRRVAWDIETSGLDWRRERIGTCQLFADSFGVVLVKVGERRPTRLMRLLADVSVEKVFHHAPFDLRFMAHAWRTEPASVRDTKVASKILNPHAPNDVHSLQQLVGRYLGVHLEKGPVRISDWLAPDLTPEQIRYASGDVVHLLRLLDVLEVALQREGRAALYDACCQFLPARVALDLDDFPDVFAY
jgi:ribonuclease D